MSLWQWRRIFSLLVRAFLMFLINFLRYLRRYGNISFYELFVFFAVFVMLQFGNLFNARCLGLKQSAFTGCFKNKGFVAIAITMLVGQLLIIQLWRFSGSDSGIASAKSK